MYIRAHSPEVRFGNYVSIMRNMYLTSSVALATIAFSDRFQKKYQTLVRIGGTLILLYSALIGFYSARNFNSYLDYLSTQVKDDEHAYFIQRISQWRMWVYINYGYVLVAISLAVLYFTIKVLH
jgi:hypothetical protein